MGSRNAWLSRLSAYRLKFLPAVRLTGLGHGRCFFLLYLKNTTKQTQSFGFFSMGLFLKSTLK